MEKAYQKQGTFTTYLYDVYPGYGEAYLTVELPVGSLGQTYLLSVRSKILSYVTVPPETRILGNEVDIDTDWDSAQLYTSVFRLTPENTQADIAVQARHSNGAHVGAVVEYFIVVVPVG